MQKILRNLRKRNLLPATQELLNRYKNPDNDPRGPWQSVTLSVQAGHAVESQFYSIESPTGKYIIRLKEDVGFTMKKECNKKYQTIIYGLEVMEMVFLD